MLVLSLDETGVVQPCTAYGNTRARQNEATGLGERLYRLLRGLGSPDQPAPEPAQPPAKPVHVLRLRQRFCLEIAEELEKQFHLQRTSYDVDQAAEWINARLPDTYDEAEARVKEFEDDMQENPVPRGPGLGERLRAALGFGKEISLTECIKAAIERLEAVRTVATCDHCKANCVMEDGKVYRYTCPECRRPGCDSCMPAGHDCLCPECEEAEFKATE
jgi:hypothetical protein